MDLSLDELYRRYPELKKALKPAQDQGVLEPLLQQTGERVAEFFSTFRNVSSVEELRQEATAIDFAPGVPRRTVSTKRKFMYLMLSGSADKHGIEEYRADDKGKPLDMEALDNGFLMPQKLLGQLRFFLPETRSESRFRYLGTTTNPKADLIAFAQSPENPTTVGTLVTMDGQTKILLYQGLVWIDPAKHQVIRVISDLLAPRPDISLKQQTTDIQFREVRFSDGQSLWLPHEVRVDTIYMHVRYRNRHRYSDYKRFTVESKDEIKRPQYP